VLIYTGSYTPGGVGGISCWRADPGGGAWTAEHPVTAAVDPSFLAWHPSGRYLYAVSESSGEVLAFACAEDGSLTPLGGQPTGGASPCHLTVDPSGAHVIVANYGDGVISVHPIGPDGGVMPYHDLVKHTGSGPVAERQEGPHAHMATFDDAGRLFATDLGTDTVHEYQLVDGRLTAIDACMITEGAGPRHLAFHPSGQVFVACELDSTIEICRYDEEGRLRPVAQTPSSVTPATMDNYPSHIECSADGRFVYLANRGLDCITTFEVLPGAQRPSLRALADTPTGGAWPRHFALLGGLLYVANQDSDTVTVLRIDPNTGIPAPAHVELNVPKPTCVLPAR
jgi:6-phosphogluconolactonase